MKAGETWKSKNYVDDGVCEFIKLRRYLGADFWLARAFLSDETEQCSSLKLLSGEEIYSEYRKVNDA